MKLGFDRYLDLDSYLHKWQCKPKLIAFICLIFSFAFVKKIVFLPVIIFTTIFLFWIAKLPVSFLLSRLRYPGIFILTVVVLLPFLTGKTVIFSILGLTIKQEGMELMLLIATRFLCIFTTTLVLLATSPFLELLKTCQSLGLSPIISDMMLLTYRYLEEFSDRLDTMKKALKLKGFSLHNHGHDKQHKSISRQLTIVANLIGSLIVRSYDDSQRVYQAMKLRGYGYERSILGKQRGAKTPLLDSLACVFTIVFAIALTTLQFID